MLWNRFQETDVHARSLSKLGVIVSRERPGNISGLLYAFRKKRSRAESSIQDTNWTEFAIGRGEELRAADGARACFLLLIPALYRVPPRALQILYSPFRIGLQTHPIFATRYFWTSRFGWAGL